MTSCYWCYVDFYIDPINICINLLHPQNATLPPYQGILPVTPVTTPAPPAESMVWVLLVGPVTSRNRPVTMAPPKVNKKCHQR